MVLLIITPPILSALETVPETSREKLSFPAVSTLNAPISHTQLIALSRSLSSQHSDQSLSDNDSDERSDSSITSSINSYSLNSLLRGTKLYRPPPPPKPKPSEEYLSLKAKLEADVEKKQYKQLLHPLSESASKRQPSPIFTASSGTISGSSDPFTSSSGDAEDLSSDPITPSLVLNILVSILFTGFATYWGLSNFRIPKLVSLNPWFLRSQPAAPSPLPHPSHRYYYPGSPSSQPVRVFASLFIAFLVGLAEVVVYSAYLRKVGKAKRIEKAIVEKKEVVGMVESDFDTNDTKRNDAPVEEAEREEIWGRGLNGGIRRRVQERWREKETDTGAEGE